MESVRVIVVGSWKTYDLLLSIHSLSLTDLHLNTRFQEECPKARRFHTLAAYNINHPPAHRSSKILKVSPAQDPLTLHISFSIFGTTESRMSAPYSLLSLSNSVINLILSAIFSLAVIETTNLACNNLVNSHSPNASWRCSRCQNRSRSISYLMQSMNVPIRRGYRHRVTRSWRSSRNLSS